MKEDLLSIELTSEALAQDVAEEYYGERRDSDVDLFFSDYDWGNGRIYEFWQLRDFIDAQDDDRAGGRPRTNAVRWQ